MNALLGSMCLDSDLLRLEAVQEGKDLWEVTRTLLHSAFSFEFCCLNFYPFLATPPMLFRERAPFATLEQFQRFCRLAPATPYVQANPGVRYVRLSDVIAEAELLKSDYYREFMQPTNSRYEICLLFWEGSLFEGLVGMHRATNHGDFSDAEISRLLGLYPHFQNALRRVLQIQRERSMRNSLELLFDQLPLATIILDWDLQVTYHNRAAKERCVRWDIGSVAAGCRKPAGGFALPEDILDCCRRLKGISGNGRAKTDPLADRHGLAIYHPRLPGLRAEVSLLQMNAATLSLPMFLIRLEDRRDCGKSDDLAGRQLALWAKLSRSEQRVAWLASQGHRNGEIARLLNKSAMTVKTQLQSVYQKLEVNGRGRLIALVRT